MVYAAHLSNGFLQFQFSPGNSSSTVNSRWTAAEILNPALGYQSTAIVSASMLTDIWSFGMLCLELLTGLPPFSEFPSDIAVAINISAGQLPRRPPTCRAITDDIWALMTKCWNRQPNYRPSITALKDEIKKLRGVAVPPKTGKERGFLRVQSMFTRSCVQRDPL